MSAQPLRQIAVQLDYGQPAEPFNQRLRQRREPRPDLDHRVARLRRDRIDDRIDDAAVGQKVLAEALARDVLRHY